MVQVRVLSPYYPLHGVFIFMTITAIILSIILTVAFTALLGRSVRLLKDLEQTTYKLHEVKVDLETEKRLGDELRRESYSKAEVDKLVSNIRTEHQRVIFRVREFEEAQKKMDVKLVSGQTFSMTTDTMIRNVNEVLSAYDKADPTIRMLTLETRGLKQNFQGSTSLVRTQVIELVLKKLLGTNEIHNFQISVSEVRPAQPSVDFPIVLKELDIRVIEPKTVKPALKDDDDLQNRIRATLEVERHLQKATR